MKSLKLLQCLTMLIVSTLLLSSCASLDAEKLVRSPVNQELKLSSNVDPEPLKITDSGRKAWQRLKGHYEVVNAINQKPFFTISDLVVFEKEGKPTLYLYDKIHNTYSYIQGSDCLPSSINKGGEVDVMLYCNNSQSDHARFSIAEIIKQPVLSDDSYDPFIGLIKVEEKTLDTKNATHIGSVQIFGYRSGNTILFKKVSNATPLNLFKAN